MIIAGMVFQKVQNGNSTYLTADLTIGAEDFCTVQLSCGRMGPAALQHAKKPFSQDNHDNLSICVGVVHHGNPSPVVGPLLLSCTSYRMGIVERRIPG